MLTSNFYPQTFFSIVKNLFQLALNKKIEDIATEISVLNGHKYSIDTVGVTISHRLVIDTTGVTKNHMLVTDTAGW